MAAPTFLAVAGLADAPTQPERDYDPDLDHPSDPMPVPKRKRKPGTTNVGRAGLRTGAEHGLGHGGFSSPVQRRVARVRGGSGFSAAEETELKQGFALIEGLMTGQPVQPVAPPPPEPTDEEIEATYQPHPFNGSSRSQYCRTCFRARADVVHG